MFFDSSDIQPKRHIPVHLKSSIHPAGVEGVFRFKLYYIKSDDNMKNNPRNNDHGKADKRPRLESSYKSIFSPVFAFPPSLLFAKATTFCCYVSELMSTQTRPVSFPGAFIPRFSFVRPWPTKYGVYLHRIIMLYITSIVL